ncbi:hypothetical protein ACFFX0_00845 [Citricoccus parietis]|uniref:Uncharacterized protein n=1 Tax=Citricoccus parietis TaxID=592307 RepID=A0ABV5FU81_9MICC
MTARPSWRVAVDEVPVVLFSGRAEAPEVDEVMEAILPRARTR